MRLGKVEFGQMMPEGGLAPCSCKQGKRASQRSPSRALRRSHPMAAMRRSRAKVRLAPCFLTISARTKLPERPHAWHSMPITGTRTCRRVDDISKHVVGFFSGKRISLENVRVSKGRRYGWQYHRPSDFFQ